MKTLPFEIRPMKSTLTIASLTIASLALLALSGAARAHVVLDQTSAPAGSNLRAVFRVGHGCDGLPTRGVLVRIPAGVQGARPMPKPGWTLTTRTDKSDVTEINWSANGKDSFVPDAFFDEFVLRATLPAEPGVLWFPIVQTCDDNGREVRNEWVQVPTEGASTRGLTRPAALLRIEPAATAATAAPAAHVHMHDGAH